MGSLFDSSSSAPPPPPKPAPPAPMPDTQSPAVKEAERRRAAEFAMRSGRASTILSGDDDTDGSNRPYSRAKLG